VVRFFTFNSKKSLRKSAKISKISAVRTFMKTLIPFFVALSFLACSRYEKENSSPKVEIIEVSLPEDVGVIDDGSTIPSDSDEIIEVLEPDEMAVEAEDVFEGLEDFDDLDQGLEEGSSIEVDSIVTKDKGMPDEGPCIPDCNEKVCGDDGCGGLCGYCQHGYACNKDGQCVEICVPDCQAKQKLCGPDGCGGECPPGCDPGFECRDDFRCHPLECVPNCTLDDGTKKQCGDDGCGNPTACGECAITQSCTEDGRCVEGPCRGIPPGKTKCLDPFTVGVCVVQNGQQMLITQDCSKQPDKICGWDAFQGAYACVDKPPCVPKCTLDDGTKKQCGDDGCGGSCGTCPFGWSCPGPKFQCRPVSGAECGSITNMGICWEDNWLYYCSSEDPTKGTIVAEDCSKENKVCAYDSEFTHQYQCMLKQ
jgi:hypothetical protein